MITDKNSMSKIIRSARNIPNLKIWKGVLESSAVCVEKHGYKYVYPSIDYQGIKDSE